MLEGSCHRKPSQGQAAKYEAHKLEAAQQYNESSEARLQPYLPLRKTLAHPHPCW
jgi:hypothetical protein